MLKDEINDLFEQLPVPTNEELEAELAELEQYRTNPINEDKSNESNDSSIFVPRPESNDSKDSSIFVPRPDESIESESNEGKSNESNDSDKKVVKVTM